VKEEPLIPYTKNMPKRPVWRRHVQRVWANTRPMPAPTEEEIRDAILVLQLPQHDLDLLPRLWEEATRILDEEGTR